MLGSGQPRADLPDGGGPPADARGDRRAPPEADPRAARAPRTSAGCSCAHGTRGALALGPRGVRELESGQRSRARIRWRRSPRTRPAHLLRTDGFAHVADIMVGSFYDPELDEGCAFEELISFHGGLGGLQTRPFLLYPPSLRAARRPDPRRGRGARGPARRGGATLAGVRAARPARDPGLTDRGTAPETTVPRPGAEAISSRPSTASMRSWMLRRPTPSCAAAGSKPAALVADLEVQLAAGDAEPDRDPRVRSRVLGGVLQRLQAAVVDGGLDRRREAPDRVGVDRDRRGRARRRGGQRADQPELRQRRRVDAVRRAGAARPASPGGRPRALRSARRPASADRSARAPSPAAGSAP